MPNATIKQMKDINDNIVYPVTKANAVYCDDGESLEGKILDGIKPMSHAATATTYGGGNATDYGHTKLSDTYDTVDAEATAAHSIGASAYALQQAYNTLNSKLNKINSSYQQLKPLKEIGHAISNSVGSSISVAISFDINAYTFLVCRIYNGSKTSWIKTEYIPIKYFIKDYQIHTNTITYCDGTNTYSFDYKYNNAKNSIDVIVNTSAVSLYFFAL